MGQLAGMIVENNVVSVFCDRVLVKRTEFFSNKPPSKQAAIRNAQILVNCLNNPIPKMPSPKEFENLGEAGFEALQRECEAFTRQTFDSMFSARQNCDPREIKACRRIDTQGIVHAALDLVYGKGTISSWRNSYQEKLEDETTGGHKL